MRSLKEDTQGNMRFTVQVTLFRNRGQSCFQLAFLKTQTFFHFIDKALFACHEMQTIRSRKWEMKWQEKEMYQREELSL